jgi:hypothetical protein
MKSPLYSRLMPSMIFLLADTGTATAGSKPAGKSVGTGVAPGAATTTSPAAQPTTGAGVAPQPQVHPKLLEAVQGYDKHVQEAETYYVQMIELVLEHKINRADVVATLMRARGITFETAQSQYSRMKNLWSDPTILQKLKNGEITLKVAREATTKKQANPASGGTTTAGTDGGKTSAETKEARYERARKAHTQAVKECGFDLKSAMMSFEADLKQAGVK